MRFEVADQADGFEACRRQDDPPAEFRQVALGAPREQSDRLRD
jgi:hypothetical protein